MSSKTSQDHYHAEGQKDGAKNEYHSPQFNPLYDFVSSAKESAQNKADTEAYKAGFDNGYKQR